MEQMGRKRPGRLKLFFGYETGNQKTKKMLCGGKLEQERGRDVVVGYLKSRQTADGTLEVLPERKVARETQGEFDLDAAIRRKPDLILMEDLAHINAEDCRHARRYQDIQELLKSGIDVWATVNVQNIESLNDTVSSITGVSERERIPDSIFDDADEVELVDVGIRAWNEQVHALRELALRQFAQRSERKAGESADRKAPGYQGEHILACLSSSPSNAKIIRTAARMANAFRGDFTGLFVETPDFSAMSPENVKCLRENIRLAEQLGAQIETVYGDDVPAQIAEFARLSGVTKIVIGRSAVKKRHIVGKMPLTDRLIATAPNLDIHIIPDAALSSTTAYRERKARQRDSEIFSGADAMKSVGMLLMASVIGQIFYKLGFYESNIITVYVLSVLLTSVITANQIYGLISAIVSVLVFNFLFTDPRYTLHAYGNGYPVTFFIMFLSAFITGSLAIRLKNHARHLAQSAFRTKVLFDTNQLLQNVEGRKKIVETTVSQLTKLLERDLVFYSGEEMVLSDPVLFPVSGEIEPDCISEKEREVAAWVLKNNKRAGATTDTCANAKCLYLAVRVNDRVYGVLGIVIGEEPLDAFENSILLSILGECALALESEKNAREKEEAAVLAKNEQLRANLLRTISHDLRTPLTSISGNASNLLFHGETFDPDTKKALYTDIYDDSMWLINLVENLLSVTRLEEGRLNLHMAEELLEEVITEALQHVSRRKEEHKIEIFHEDEFLMARMDARLIVQVIVNLVDNAVKYTPHGSCITISTKRKGGDAVVSVADDGPGIPDERKERIFDMFYTEANRAADSRRGMGLGLSLCRSIIHAHGGSIRVSDRIPHGAVFTFTLPAGEVELHE